MLTMICGIPNAGKTTFSKRFDGALHLDDVGSIRRITEMIKQIDGEVVAEGYFGRREERQRVRKAHNGYSICIYLDITIDESIKREDRGRNKQILQNALRFFEPPTLDEGWDEIIILRGDNEQRIHRQTED